MSNIDFQEFENSNLLAKDLAATIAEKLKHAISANGHALLAVSGGSTPVKFFEHLSTINLDWQRVIVTLVDERWVDANNERSNAKFIREKLLINLAAKAKFVGQYCPGKQIIDGLVDIENRIAALPLPIDALVLGMGGDGHTASFFREGDGLKDAVDLTTTKLVARVVAHGAGEPRVTLTLPVILNSRYLALHFESDAKRKVFDEAKQPGDADELPIRHVLRSAENISVYWAP